MPPSPSKQSVLYPSIKVELCALPETTSSPSRVAPLTEERVRKLLGWTEEDGEKFHDDYLLKFPDGKGKKIKCTHNTRNRPFGYAWAKALAQDILHSGSGIPISERRWQFNGENVIIGRNGQVLSGQHRLIAFLLAVYEWRKNREFWLKYWPVEPYLECILVFGIDESQRVIRTMDNVKPRSLGDVFYTHEAFSGLGQVQRRECARMAGACVDFLWDRTNLRRVESVKFQTTPESVDFFERHKRIIECVSIIYKLNTEKGARISDLNLTPGHAAGMLYLMGASDTDPDEYLSGNYARSEKAIAWGYDKNAEMPLEECWHSAIVFWERLTDLDENPEFQPVKTALANLIDPEHGEGGRQIEKTSVIARAWQMYVDGADFKEHEDALSLQDCYKEIDGKKKFAPEEYLEFGGIDMGPSVKKSKGERDVPEPDEVEKVKTEVRKENMEKMRDKPKPQPKRTIHQQLTELKEKYPGKVLALQADKGTYNLWGNDATFAAKVLGMAKLEKVNKMDKLKTDEKGLEQLKKAKYNVVVVSSEEVG